MKKLIVALLLLFVLTVSVAACSCGDSPETNDSGNETSVPANTQKQPIFDTDDRWGELIPMT